jgi:hypothetical protein
MKNLPHRPFPIVATYHEIHSLKKKEEIQDSFEFCRFKSMTRHEIPSGLWPTWQVRLSSACKYKYAKPPLYLGVVAALYKHTDPWVLECEPSDPACGRQ